MPPSLRSRRRYVRYLISASALLFLYTLFQLHLDPDPDSQPSLFAALRPALKIEPVKSSYDWRNRELAYPVSSLIPLPTGKPRPLPRIQHVFQKESKEKVKLLAERRDRVRRAFLRCWRSYKQFAWMRDELTPISGSSKDPFGGWAATLIDALDTLWIMDLKDDFYEAVKAVATIDWAQTPGTSCNVFETTIRHLGGLLSAYDLSHEKVLLFKAVELGDMLYTAFDTPNRMPPFWLEYEAARKGRQVADTHQPSASPCSLSMEFTRLAQITGDSKYYDAIARITKVLERSQNSTKLPGMWPTFIDLRHEHFDEGDFTLGALADSLYEYLPKTYALLGGLEPVYKKLYMGAVDTIQKNLLFRPMLPDKADILFPGTAYVRDDQVRLDAEGQHLGCFVGGMFALGGKLFELDEHVEIGARLTKGCIYAYNAFATGIMPEIFNMIACDSLNGCEWDDERWKAESDGQLPKGFTRARDRYYILRPEAIESVFLLYRITGREEFREDAWKMFEAIQKATESTYGNAGIEDVTEEHPRQRDSMESFWLAETLKYFYLIFSPPDLVSLDKYILNTEAHPFKFPR